MHLFEIKNNFVRRTIMVVSLPSLLTFIYVVSAGEALVENVQEFIQEMPGVKKEVIKIWKSPLKG